MYVAKTVERLVDFQNCRAPNPVQKSSKKITDAVSGATTTLRKSHFKTVHTK